MYHTATILKGDQTGRKIGIPTINLNPDILNIKFGIYACLIQIDKKMYKGALFFGPRLIKNEEKPSLEIYIIGLKTKEEHYGKKIKFVVKDFIRDVKKHKSFEELKKEIKKDIDKVNKILQI